jgi:hypothetical protein
MFAMAKSKQFLSLSLTAQSVETLSKWKNLLQEWPRKYYYAEPVFSSEKTELS